jgi:uncharacterized Fe-S cluster-containing radical SAM superfamily protein
MSSPGVSNPIKVADELERTVVRRDLSGRTLRKYYGFARGRWYGGSLAAYVIGCNLDCAFCWAWFKDRYDLGTYPLPEDVVGRLVSAGRASGVRTLRISGGEPTIGFDHLIQVLRLFTEKAGPMKLVVETNGILIGARNTLASELGELSGRNVVMRVSIKGANPETFSSLTGSPSEYFNYQLSSIKNLIEVGYEPGRTLSVAVMSSFNTPREVAELIYRLTEIDDSLAESIELELVRMYGGVRKKLQARGITPYRYLDPSNFHTQSG